MNLEKRHQSFVQILIYYNIIRFIEGNKAYLIHIYIYKQ